MAQAVLSGIRELGMLCLPWTEELYQWRLRVELLRAVDKGGDWPDVSEEALLTGLEDWLVPFLQGISRRSQFSKIDLAAAFMRCSRGASSGSLMRWLPLIWKCPQDPLSVCSTSLGGRDSAGSCGQAPRDVWYAGIPAIAEGKVSGSLSNLPVPCGKALADHPRSQRILEEWVSSRQSGNAGAVSEAPVA